MSWFADFLGGAAGAGADLLKEDRQREEKLADREVERKARLDDSAELYRRQEEIEE